MVVEISTKHNFFKLLNLCKNTELNMGRKLNKHRNRERIIDIDILTFNNSIYSDETITLPHPKIHERKFVLIPWVEISPDYFLVNYIFMIIAFFILYLYFRVVLFLLPLA